MKTEIKIPEDISIEENFLKEIERKFSVKVSLINRDLEIESENAYNLLRAKEIINALLLGFSREDCKKLFKDNYCLEIVEIKKFLINKNNRDRLRELKGRVIGEKGRAKRNIEELTKTKIIIHRNLIGIIGSEENVDIAKRAIEMLLEGRMHSTVYKFLTKELQKRRSIII